MQVMKAITNYGLQTKVIGLAANNTTIIFGSLLTRGKESVLTKIKSRLNRNIIDFG
jgi:hypothetical protein